MTTHGVVDHDDSRRTDYLYRISLKCLIRNQAGEVLVVKESGRDWWDLPGGGMDHGEDLRTAIAREMKEEVAMEGDFDYAILEVDEPRRLDIHGFWQLRLIFQVIPHNLAFRPGDDGDSVMFILPEALKDSMHPTERLVCHYAKISR